VSRKLQPSCSDAALPFCETSRHEGCPSLNGKLCAIEVGLIARKNLCLMSSSCHKELVVVSAGTDWWILFVAGGCGTWFCLCIVDVLS